MNIDAHWYDDRDNLSLLARYMARAGYASERIAEMVSEPWKWEGEFDEARSWAEKMARSFEAIRV